MSDIKEGRAVSVKFMTFDGFAKKTVSKLAIVRAVCPDKLLVEYRDKTQEWIPANSERLR